MSHWRPPHVSFTSSQLSDDILTCSLNPGPHKSFQAPPSIVPPIHQELSEIPWHVQYIFSWTHSQRSPVITVILTTIPFPPLCLSGCGYLCVMCMVRAEVVSKRAEGSRAVCVLRIWEWWGKTWKKVRTARRNYLVGQVLSSNSFSAILLFIYRHEPDWV